MLGILVSCEELLVVASKTCYGWKWHDQDVVIPTMKDSRIALHVCIARLVYSIIYAL